MRRPRSAKERDHTSAGADDVKKKKTKDGIKYAACLGIVEYELLVQTEPGRPICLVRYFVLRNKDINKRIYTSF